MSTAALGPLGCDVQRGRDLAQQRAEPGDVGPLAETAVYPRLATQMILVGEESGRLEEMLTRVADVYDREVATAIKRFLAVLEPVLILGLAVMVGRSRLTETGVARPPAA